MVLPDLTNTNDLEGGKQTYGSGLSVFAPSVTVDKHGELVHKKPFTPEEYMRPYELGLVFREQVDFNFFRAVFAEFLATAFFLFNCLTLITWSSETSLVDLPAAAHLIVSLNFGLNIFVLVWVTSGLSGGNLNPAVSLCLCLGRRITVIRTVCYILAQMAGAVAGSALAEWIAFPRLEFKVAGSGANEVAKGLYKPMALTAELLLTMLLCLTVLIGTNARMWQLMRVVKMAPQLPAALGLVVTIAHFVLIPIDGCSINPARSFGPAVTGNKWAGHWVFWVGPFLGAVAAILLWELILRPPANKKDLHRV